MNNVWYIRLMLLVALLAFAPFASAQDAEKDADFIAGRAALEDGFYDVAADLLQKYIDGTIVKRKKANGSVFLFLAWHKLGQDQKIIDWLNENAKLAVATRYEASYFYWYAQAHYALGQYDAALEYLKMFDARYSEDELKPYAVRLRALALRDTGRREEAEKLFRLFYETYPEREEMPDHLMDWSSLLLAMKQPDAAIDRLEELVRRFPDHEAAFRARLWLGQWELEKKRYDAAETWLTPLATNSGSPATLRADAWFGLAASSVARGALTNALMALSEAEVLSTNAERRVEARIDRARLLMQLNRLDEAVQVMDETVFTMASLPQAERAQLELSDLLRAQGRFALAVEAYQRYIESFSDPDGQRHALFSKSWCLWELKRYAEAATAFEKAYDNLRNPALREQALVKAADAYFMNGQYRLAGAAYEKALVEFARSPSRADVLMQAAESFARAKDTTNTVRVLTELVDTHGEKDIALAGQLRLARYHEELRAWPDALAAYNEFLVRFSASERYPEALLGRAMLRYRMGAYPEALADFERLMSEFAGTVWAERAYFMRGWCYYQMGDTQQAVSIGRSFLAKHPESTWTAEVTYWLAEHDYNTQNYGVAETNFAALAAFQSTNTLADDALYWAGRSAFEQKAFRRAIDYFGQLIRLYTNSPLIPESRFAQGDSLTEIGDFAGAILAYDEIIKKYPASPLFVRALGRIGDCQFTLGSDRIDRYQEAIASYRAALAHPQIAPALAVQAEYKLARTYERIGRTEEAVTHYLNVVYGWLAGRGEGIPMDEVWFVRAAFSAAALKEVASAWDDAAKIYQRVIDSGITAGGDAALRLERIAELKKAGSTTASETRNMP